jgi:hypothetical protein
MIVRNCEPKDLPSVLNFAIVMLNHLRQQPGSCQFVKDENMSIGGIIETLGFLLFTNEHILLSMVDERGRVCGFLGGRIEIYPSYYVHKKVGAILHIYPMSGSSNPLVEAFDKWAKENGCTARTSYMAIHNDLAEPLMESLGMKPVASIYSMGYTNA